MNTNGQYQNKGRRKKEKDQPPCVRKKIHSRIVNTLQ